MSKKYLLIVVLALPYLFLLCSPENEKEGGKMDSSKIIKLPEPVNESDVSVEEALKNRRSIRSYQDKELKLEHLSQILWSSYGITKSMESGPDFLRGGLRTAPSAGARYPLEIYAVCGNVSDLAAGIYKYDSKEHTLKLLQSGDQRSELSEAAYGQSFIAKAPASLFYSAVYERTTSKYGQRGRERYVCMDLGHSAENVYLQAYSLGIGTCAVGAFSDQDVSKVMQIPEQETPLYIMPLGYIESQK
ncbi:MAG: SagB/ThcOx family dehydrogenase [Candidatus Marinimicrobia bacterium]|nr:SagB/ThcOx family dehydrogenase [Candidatus Neomarinimicrobiota bacterium]